MELAQDCVCCCTFVLTVLKLWVVVPESYLTLRRRTTYIYVALWRSLTLRRLMSYIYGAPGPPLWSSGQSFWLQIQRSRVRFPALPDFLSSSGSGTGSTQPREMN